MTQAEQMEFIKELSQRIAEELCEAIANDKVPLEWDGHELRCLLAYRHEQSASMSLLRRYPQRKRARDYRNTVLCENL